jgi:hypothetical protein
VRITTYPVYRGQLTTVNKAVYTFELYHGGYPAFSTAQNVLLFLFVEFFLGVTQPPKTKISSMWWLFSVLGRYSVSQVRT